jgi:predicted nucleic-acid-binding Zn-ribbon protein
MPDVSIICPKCDAAMREGFMLDDLSVGKWVDGPPEYGFLGVLKISGRDMHKMTAYRCPRCGYIELYAPFPNISEP